MSSAACQVLTLRARVGQHVFRPREKLTPGDILHSHAICHDFTLLNGGAAPPRIPRIKLPMTANSGPSSRRVAMLMQLENP